MVVVLLKLMVVAGVRAMTEVMLLTGQQWQVSFFNIKKHRKKKCLQLQKVQTQLDFNGHSRDFGALAKKLKFLRKSILRSTRWLLASRNASSPCTPSSSSPPSSSPSSFSFLCTFSLSFFFFSFLLSSFFSSKFSFLIFVFFFLFLILFFF